MKVETATSLTELGLKISAELNDVVREIQASESEDEFKRLREAIGRAMGALYFEILEPIWREHPQLIPADRPRD